MADAAHITRLVTGVAAFFGVVAITAANGCAKYNSTDSPELFLPDQNQFIQAGGVNEFMMVRCAALDCHGQIGRPLPL